jgi:hypothetical protein
MSGLPEKWKEAIREVVDQYFYPDDTEKEMTAEITAALTKLWQEQQAQEQRDLEAANKTGFRHGREWELAEWERHLLEHSPRIPGVCSWCSGEKDHDAELSKRVRNQALLDAAGVCIPTEEGDDCNGGCHDSDAAAIRALLDKPESTVREQP